MGDFDVVIKPQSKENRLMMNVFFLFGLTVNNLFFLTPSLTDELEANMASHKNELGTSDHQHQIRHNHISWQSASSQCGK